MSRSINIHNKSGHPQEFEVHGWNGNKNITVNAGATSVIAAPDKTSGAIIALHDGHEGEQAEITKDGFGGNDFIDLSNIVGAGGNLTIMQVGNISTLKGDPEFMQHMNTAWHKASQDLRNRLSGCVHLNAAGNVIRIDAIKDHPELETLVRTFADGKTYIGVGAWGGSIGNANDNAQSSAAQGNKDLLITYSDDSAYPGGTPVFHAPEVAHRPVARMVMQTKSVQTGSGPGIILTNKSNHEESYFFYDNYWNGNGTAGANFDHPLKSVKLGPGAKTYVDLPTTFKGRVQRGTTLPATWVEFQVSASNDHAAHGDISLEQGCDGAATIASTDGSNRINGFTNEVVNGAPPRLV
ncbi:hypothetical protein G7Y89_g5933 [Cudoniella acicularis]|uniref:Uncharacterized protein n=1 Tax=Cudoniella acicularis TaxID=354080 RepID=A0A8H4RLG9_9HELO|nr:hypothetical protein G7Y89_g5933 [Cudoniella acicularis]